MSAPREIDRARVLNELVHRWDETAGASGNEEPGASWVLDQLAYMGHLTFRPRPLCGLTEGKTGIRCELPKGHVMPDGSLRTVHEGKTTPEQTEQVGYEMFVRWPVDGSTLPDTDEQVSGDYHKGCQNQWPAETVTGDIDRGHEPDEARLLLVHPSVWKSLADWLRGMRIKVDPIRLAERDGPTTAYAMSPMWGSDE